MAVVSGRVVNQTTPWGGGKKRGGRKTSRMTPLPKRVLGPPSYGTFSTPLRCQCSVFPVQKSTTEQNRSSFGGVQKFFARVCSLVRFPPPIRFAPPHITAQVNQKNSRRPSIRKTSHTEGGHKAQGSADPRFATGVLVPEILEVSFLQTFVQIFPGIFLGTPEKAQKQPQPFSSFLTKGDLLKGDISNLDFAVMSRTKGQF